MGAAEDHEDLTRLVLILFRLRARAPLDEIQQLHTRFGWLAAFAGDPPHERATKQAVRDRLAAKLNDWLPDTATGLEAIGLTMRRPVRHLIRRRLTGQASLKEDAAGLQTSWDDEQARDTWSVNTVTGWLRDAADSIATALLRSAGQPAGIRPPRPSDPAPASWQDGIYDGLVRREPLLAEIDTWLTSGTANLAILRGRPGDGKSCLLITFLRELVANRAGTGITLVAAIQRENRNADPFRLDDLLAAIVQHRLARAQPGDDIPTQYGGITSQDRLRQAEQVVMSQPRDQPALIVVDAIDQLEDDRGTGSFVEGLGRLVRAADGTGYRFLLASRRSLPVDIGSARAHVIRLRADEDESDLRTALAAIVEPLNDTDRVRVVEGLQRRADGNWLWACLNARRIVAEAPTVGVPDPIEPREGLDGLWSDGVESIARRVGPEIYRRSVRSLLGWLAAAIDGRLGVNELRYVGKLTRDELADIAEASEPFIDVREDGTFALCHPDFSRWVLHPEHGAVAAESAHHTLAVGLTEMGIVTGWSPVTKPYAALHVLDHWHATFVLDPFPPDRPERVARLQQLITDPRWADRAGTVLVPILNTAELVPELRMPNSDLPVRDSIRQVMTLAWTITLVGMVIYEQMSAETAELADDMIARHSESQISSREAYMELLALVPNPAELVSRVIWGGLLDGLITVTASEDGGVDLMPSAERVRRAVLDQPLQVAPELTVFSVLHQLALQSPSELLDVVREIHGRLTGDARRRRLLADAVTAIDVEGISDDELHRQVVQVCSQLIAGFPSPVDHNPQDAGTVFDLCVTKANSLWALSRLTAAEADDLVAVQETIVALRSAEPEPDEPTIAQSRRNVLWARAHRLELQPLEVRQEAEILALIAASREELANAPTDRREHALITHLSCLGPALDLQPDLINERLTALRELIALQRNRLPEERSPAFADHALTMLKRWQMFREEPVTRDDLPIALRDARFAVHNASPAKLADALQALMLVLAVIVDLEPSRPAAEELAQACRQLLDQDPDGSVRTTATKHLQAAERIAAEYPAVGLDQPEPTVDDLRARWQTATEDDRIEAAIRLANAILDLPPGAADMAELLALQEEICKRNPITADTRVLVYHFNRARALGMLGRADEAAGVFAEIAEQEVDVTFRLIACRTWIGVLRQHRVSEPEPWETLLRTVNAIAALVPAEHDVAIKNLLSEAGLADLTFRRRDDTSAIAPPVLADLFAYCEAARTAAPTSGSSDRADSLRRTAGLLIRLQPMERTAEWIRWVDLAREAVRLPGAFIDPYPSVLEILSDVLLAWWQAAPAERRDPALSAEALGYAFRAVEVARPDNRFGAIHSLVNALHVVGPPDKDLSLFIWAGTSLLRAKDYSLTDEQWIQIANMTTDALRRHAAFSSPLAEREDRELLCAVYRMAMARFAGGSPQHVSSAALLATEIANLPASTTLIDERIELLWYTYREAERADLNPNYVLLNLANTLSMRAGRSQDPAQRLANLREAWRVSADARDNATDPVERLTCTANWAGHALSLVTEGELGGNQTLREILSALRAVVGDVEPVEALWILRTLSPLVIEAMKREGIWPVMPEDSSVEV